MNIKAKSSFRSNVYVEFVRFNIKVSRGQRVGTNLWWGGPYTNSHHSHFGEIEKNYVLISKNQIISISNALGRYLKLVFKWHTRNGSKFSWHPTPKFVVIRTQIEEFPNADCSNTTTHKISEVNVFLQSPQDRGDLVLPTTAGCSHRESSLHIGAAFTEVWRGRGAVRLDWRKLRNEELHGLYLILLQPLHGAG